MQTLPVTLTGMPGCGKSTLGKALAKYLGWDFVDTDRMIESKIGLSCDDIFKLKGKEFFRQRELESVEEALQKKQIVALGGGAFIQKETHKIIQKGSSSIYIHLPLVLLQERLFSDPSEIRKRPLVQNENDLEELYDDRLLSYRLAKAKINVEKDDTSEVLIQKCLATNINFGLSK